MQEWHRYHRVAGSCRIRLPVCHPHTFVSAAGPTDVVHLFTSALGPTMEVTRNKKVMFLEDIPELGGVSSGVQGSYCKCTSLHHCSPWNSPAGVSPSLLPDSFYKGWLSDLGSRSPSPAGARIPGDRKLGRAAELRWVFLFPRYLGTGYDTGLLPNLGKCCWIPRRHEGLVDTGLKQAVLWYLARVGRTGLCWYYFAGR